MATSRLAGEELRQDPVTLSRTPLATRTIATPLFLLSSVPIRASAKEFVLQGRPNSFPAGFWRNVAREQ